LSQNNTKRLGNVSKQYNQANTIATVHPNIRHGTANIRTI